MARADMTMKLEPSDEFKKLLEEAQADFKRLHTELTDDMKAMIAAEVSKQVEARLHDLSHQTHLHAGHRMETK